MLTTRIQTKPKILLDNKESTTLTSDVRSEIREAIQLLWLVNKSNPERARLAARAIIDNLK